MGGGTHPRFLVFLRLPHSLVQWRGRSLIEWRWWSKIERTIKYQLWKYERAPTKNYFGLVELKVIVSHVMWKQILLEGSYIVLKFFSAESILFRVFRKPKFPPKIWKFLKFVETLKICQKSENLSRIWKFVENLKNCQKSENLSKIWKFVENLKIC